MPTAYLIIGLVADSLTLVLGFILLVTASVYLSDIEYMHDTQSPIYTLSILSIIIGALTVLFATGLILWILKQYPILTTIFSILLIIVILLALICAILLLITRSKLEARTLNETITTFNDYSNPNNTVSTKGAVERIQRSFKCCGVKGPTDWKNLTSSGTTTPDSCCRHITINCGKNALATNDSIYFDGCAQSVYQYAEGTYTTLIGMNFTVVIIAGVDSAISLYLMRLMRKRRDSY